MSVTTTTHYGLKKPDGSEAIKPDPFNDNADVIDEQLHKISVLSGTAAPTTSTAGAVGQFYLDTTAKKLYQCMTQGPVYTWASLASGKWRLLQAYTTAGSYTFTTPSDVTELGAFIIGGGSSGAAKVNTSNQRNCSGGASGRTAVKIITGSLAATYPVVVGAGGAAATANSTPGDGGAYSLPAAGGSSSFAGMSATGGSAAVCSTTGGGQGTIYVAPQYDLTMKPLAFGEIRLFQYNIAQGETHPTEAVNPFDYKKLLIAGGSMFYNDNQSTFYIESNGITDDYGNTGSPAVINYSSSGSQVAVATKGTSYGCGGGAAFCRYTGTAPNYATPGAGCDGAVLIYGR